MTRRQPDREVEALGHRLFNAADTKPLAIEHLWDVERSLSALRAAQTDTGPRSIGEHGDPVLATIEALETVQEHRDRMAEAEALIKDAIDEYSRRMEAALGFRGGKALKHEQRDDDPKCTRRRTAKDGSTYTCGGYLEDYTRGDGTIGFRDLCSACRQADKRAAAKARAEAEGERVA